MNGKFDNDDKQDLLKRGFSEDNISYLESLDSDDKKPLYLKIIEVMDNNGITTEQIMEKVKGVVQNITNKPELEPEVVEEKETVVPETEVVEEVVTSEPEVVEEVIIPETDVVKDEKEKEVVTPETEVVEEEKVVTEEGGKKTLKNRNKKKYKKSRKGKNSRKGRKSRKGYKPTKNKKSKHHK